MTESTTERISALAQANLISAHAYLDAAKSCTDRLLEARFRSWSRERNLQARQLSEFLAKSGLAQSRVADWLLKIDQAYFGYKTNPRQPDQQTFPSSALEGEVELEKMYERLLSDPDVLPLNALLKKQYAQVRAIRFNIRRMCP